MKIALIADIHANLPAFEAVLKDAAVRGADAVWCLGDVVGYGPFPNECTDLARARCQRIIIGNHDEKVAGTSVPRKSFDTSRDAYKSFIFNWTREALKPDAIAWLSALPREDRFVHDNSRFLLCHASTEGLNQGITLHTSSSRIEALARAAGADMVCVGHTHDPFVRRCGKVTFLNPGSVGRSFDADPRAAYMLLSSGKTGIEAEICRVAYPMEPVLQAMEVHRFPARLIAAFRAARSPADIRMDDGKRDLMEAALALGTRVWFEEVHARQVAKLSLQLFDMLKELHGFGLRERALLQAAALLHDVGISRGVEGHHKMSRDILLEDTTLPLSDRERQVVALVARYHRKSLPKEEHRLYAVQPDQHKILVEKLGALVRMADGLDRTHGALVKDISVEIFEDEVFIRLEADAPLDAEVAFGKEKSDLFVRAYGRGVRFLVNEFKAKTGKRGGRRGR
jgi:putative phosphoesterase